MIYVVIKEIGDTPGYGRTIDECVTSDLGQAKKVYDKLLARLENPEPNEADDTIPRILYSSSGKYIDDDGDIYHVFIWLDEYPDGWENI